MARRPASRKKAKAAPAKRKAASKPAKKPAKAAAKSTAKSGQWVYTFGGGRAQGRSGMKELLGGKGANLAEMANLGLPVPPGFTITTAVCTHYYAHDKKYPKDLEKQVEEVNRTLARYETIKRFAILPRELSIEDGELTPTLKLKRRVIHQNHAEEIERLYS